MAVSLGFKLGQGPGRTREGIHAGRERPATLSADARELFGEFDEHQAERMALRENQTAGSEQDVSQCLICGSTDDLTVEHIIPQTLWKRFGIDPNMSEGDVFKTRTTLCRSCNAGTASLHERGEMMTLIETGDPITKRTLQHLADWGFWVLLLLGLSRGTAVVPEDAARELLVSRFSLRVATSIPKGVRVYAGVATTLEPSPSSPPSSFAVARVDDPNVYCNGEGEAIGMTARGGQSLQAAQSIGLGKAVLLVLGPTLSSGPGHEARLDEAAGAVALTRIHPLPPKVPELGPREYDLAAVRDLFMSLPFGDDFSLLPGPLRRLMEPLHRESRAPRT